MSRGKLWLLVVMVAASLTVSAAGAARAGYVLVVKNQTGHEVEAEAWEIKFIGAYKSLGAKTVAVGGEQSFTSHGGFCLFMVKATVKLEGGQTVTVQKMLKKDGMECANCSRKVVKKPDGGYDITH